MKRILVTGGAGYIGSHCCKALAIAGYEPVTYDNLERGHEWAVKWGPLEIGDIRDQDRLEKVIKQYQPQAVMHFAAYAYVGESVEYPDRYYDNNVVGTQTLLEAMKNTGMDKIVFSSTCAVYGDPVEIPITENHPQNPINPYGKSKLKIEDHLRKYNQEYKIRSISLRYFNAAGADPEGEIGESHDPETHLIPLVMDTVIGNKPEITIYGDNYDTPDGTCIRDYIHVTDLANAHIMSLQAIENNQESKFYNVGVGKGYSVLEVISKASEITNKDISVSVGPRREGDPAKLIASSTYISKDLDWKPLYSSLENIISTAWKWHQQKF